MDNLSVFLSVSRERKPFTSPAAPNHSLSSPLRWIHFIIEHLHIPLSSSSPCSSWAIHNFPSHAHYTAALTLTIVVVILLREIETWCDRSPRVKLISVLLASICHLMLRHGSPLGTWTAFVSIVFRVVISLSMGIWLSCHNDGWWCECVYSCSLATLQVFHWDRGYFYPRDGRCCRLMMIWVHDVLVIMRDLIGGTDHCFIIVGWLDLSKMLLKMLVWHRVMTALSCAAHLLCMLLRHLGNGHGWNSWAWNTWSMEAKSALKVFHCQNHRCIHTIKLLDCFEYWWYT